jgi:hypothetical protein
MILIEFLDGYIEIKQQRTLVRIETRSLTGPSAPVDLLARTIARSARRCRCGHQRHFPLRSD